MILILKDTAQSSENERRIGVGKNLEFANKFYRIRDISQYNYKLVKEFLLSQRNRTTPIFIA